MEKNRLNSESLRYLTSLQTYLQLFDQKRTKIFFFFNDCTRNGTIGNTLCHFLRFHLLQIFRAKLRKMACFAEEIEKKKNIAYVVRDGIRLTLKLGANERREKCFELSLSHWYCALFSCTNKIRLSNIWNAMIKDGSYFNRVTAGDCLHTWTHSKFSTNMSEYVALTFARRRNRSCLCLTTNSPVSKCFAFTRIDKNTYIRSVEKRKKP